MGKFSSDEVGHGDEVFDASIAAGAGSRLLKRPIHGLDAGIVFAGLKAIEYARKMLGDGPAEALEGFESAATGPTQPAFEEGLGLIRRRGLGIDRAQRFLDAPGACGLEIRGLYAVSCGNGREACGLRGR